MKRDSDRIIIESERLWWPGFMQLANSDAGYETETPFSEKNLDADDFFSGPTGPAKRNSSGPAKRNSSGPKRTLPGIGPRAPVNFEPCH